MPFHLHTRRASCQACEQQASNTASDRLECFFYLVVSFIRGENLTLLEEVWKTRLWRGVRRGRDMCHCPLTLGAGSFQSLVIPEPLAQCQGLAKCHSRQVIAE